jgi:spore coat protein A, manganese oxidase
MTRSKAPFAFLFIALGVIVFTSPAYVAVGPTPLNPGTLTKYLDPLPTPAKLDGTVAQTISISEFTQQVLPSNFKAGPYGGKTLVWGYNNSYPGPTIEARRGVPLSVRFLNNLVSPALLAKLPIDQTLMWADPLGCNGMSYCATQRYTGPVPVVTHLHGGEVPSAFDGHPRAWFTPASAIIGPGWVSPDYTYPNAQEAATLWYHDHTLGITRLNVYAGLAGFYLLRDPANEPASLPSGPFEREIAIQDRMFDTNGQLFYPTEGGGYGSSHPFWIPMFMGDTIVVNGKVWPYFNVEPRRYRLRLLNGSNARIYTLQFQTTSGSAGPAFWQIGTDGGLLNQPVKLSQLTIAPGERADVIVDFTGKQGTSYILKNSDSSWSNSSIGEIMKVNVALPLSSADTSLSPTTTTTLRPNNAIVPLSPTVTSSTVTRRMTLEQDRDTGAFLLNGKPFDGAVTELPRVGATEVWEFSNRTGVTHPIHLHLVQFQVQSGDSASHYRDSGGTSSGTLAWKDTVRVGSWDTIRVVVRFAPQDVPAGGVQPGVNRFPFNPAAQMGVVDTFGFPGGPGYVWHCHILEHEDNEMMRPYLIRP